MLSALWLAMSPLSRFAMVRSVGGGGVWHCVGRYFSQTIHRDREKEMQSQEEHAEQSRDFVEK